MAVQLAFTESKKPSKREIASPFDSRLGGLPSFYNSVPAPPTCSKCHEKLFLVLQVYAPTDKDRTLYIFGCNSAVCNKFDGVSQTHGDWKVLRQQQAAEIMPASSKVLPPSVPAMNEWGATDDWSDAAEAGGGWGTSLKDAIEEMSAVPADPPMTANSEEVRATVSLTPKWLAGPRFDAYDLTMEETEEAGYNTDSSDEETDAGRRKVVVRSREDAHAAKLLKEYTAWEAAAGTEECASAADSESDHSDDGHAEHPKALKKAAQHRIPGGDKRKGLHKSSSTSAAASSEGAAEEKYEKVPPKFRYLLQFQKYLLLNGQPTFRYAYGSTPIWPVGPKQRLIDPKKCLCGADRAFELQIFATALEILDVEGASPSKAPSAAENSILMQLQSNTMDFLTVIVYSCIDSCDGSGEEQCFVIQSKE